MSDRVQLARPGRDINHVLTYGQSLASGQEGWPALSLTQPFDNLMLGDSVRPLDGAKPVWQPTGPAAFRPLCATVQEFSTGALLTPEQVAALPADAVHLGETVLEGALNSWRARQLAGGATSGQSRLLASSCGVGARTLEALSKGAKPDLFNRLRDCVRLARSTAEAANLSYGLTALLFLQGEHNNFKLDGGTAETGAYKRLLHAFHKAVLADLATGIAGQAEAPGLFLYQTGGAYSSEMQSVPQAQLEFALEAPGCFMVAPTYPVTEKGGHLDANGYRWMGAQFGKVLHRVLTLGQPWQPLHPVRAEFTGKTVRVEFHVPVPPLAWGRPIVGHRMVEPQQQGFTVLDFAGSISIRDVQLAGPDAVEIFLGREPEGPTTVRYADRLHGGRGALHDSDAEVARDTYVYEATTGHRPSANLKELVGKPYPLMNWCAAFNIPATMFRAPPPPPGPSWRLLNDRSPPPPPSIPERRGLLAWLRDTWRDEG